jgi:hypothetical protein
MDDNSIQGFQQITSIALRQAIQREFPVFFLLTGIMRQRSPFAKYGLIFFLCGTSHQEVHKVRKKIPSWVPLPSKSTVNKGFSPFWGAMLPSPPGPTPLAAPRQP